MPGFGFVIARQSLLQKNVLAGYNFKTFYLRLLSAITSSRYWLD